MSNNNIFDFYWMDDELKMVIRQSADNTYDRRGQFLTPLNIISMIFNITNYKSIFSENIDIPRLQKDAASMVEVVPEFIDYEGVEMSADLSEHILALYRIHIKLKKDIDVAMFLYFCYYSATSEFMKYVGDEMTFLRSLMFSDTIFENMDKFCDLVNEELDSEGTDENELFGENGEEMSGIEKFLKKFESLGLRKLEYDKNLGFVGRGEEIERALQVLCRLDKSNVLFIGESGVGKTAMIRGMLSAIKERENLPDKIKRCNIIEMSVGAILSNSQFMGELEKNLISLFNAIAELKDVILFIDDIHSMVGAGRTDRTSMDASTIIRPYLSSGSVKIVGCTTYDEHKKNILPNKSFDTLFSKIDINEPSIEDCIAIINGIKARYEKHHKVNYGDELVEYIVRQSSKYISDRCLPSSAVDLLDEVGAKCEMKHRRKVKKEDVKESLAKICNVAILNEGEEEQSRVMNLEERMSNEIYGQSEAVSGVCEAVLMSEAGLQDDGKPMASLLFVGPTGVGKTETARVLAEKLGVSFQKFDMSEYAEKHTVSKLIGSPAGYVGYEEGGLLTDAVRKNPHCVLLLDEIEKAHSDIYNVLLQIMDYATLTDNKGQKVDFRHVVLIMTTNAGARYAGKANSGFVKKTSAGEAMMDEVKKTFSPEFINRLTAINVFREMDREMASLILDKKIRNLEEKLKAKGVSLNVEKQAHELMLEKGYSVEYGGRNIERTVNNMLKRLLMREILFGCLKNGGEAKITVKEGELKVERT